MKAIDCRPEARQAAAASVPPADVHTPADRYQELFHRSAKRRDF